MVFVASFLVAKKKRRIKFFDILKLIKDKLFGKKEEREQYMDVANELYNKDIIDTNQFDEMYDIYESSNNFEESRSKGDDFER